MNDRPAYNSNRAHSICAACRSHRKKCTAWCPLAPYFPVENTREFQAVQSVFGVSNLTKMMLGVDEADRRQLVESLVREALMREKDPVLGIYGEYARVLNELLHFKALAHTNSVQILQLQSQIKRMRSYDNGNGNNSMSVPSDHSEWHYRNRPVPYLGRAGAVAVTANETYNNNLMAYVRGNESCTIPGIPYTSNMQNHLHIKNERSPRQPPYRCTNHPSSIGDDLTSSILPQAHEGN